MQHHLIELNLLLYLYILLSIIFSLIYDLYDILNYIYTLNLSKITINYVGLVVKYAHIFHRYPDNVIFVI